MDTSYPGFVESLVKKFAKDPIAEQGLKLHQNIAVNFINGPMTRGILLCHGMGTGKTVVAANIAAESLKKKRPVVFMSPKSLRVNFEETLKKLSDEADEVSYVSMNASNMMRQVIDSQKTDEELDFDYAMGIVTNTKLDGTLLIVDEAHNLFNAIANGSKNAVNFYEKVMKEKLKIVFMTGTPIVNHPHELAFCFNMLQGFMEKPGVSKQVVLLPEERAEFEKHFLVLDPDPENPMPILDVKSPDKFSNRIYGLVSYFTDTSSDAFPEDLGLEVVKVPMSQEQYKVYSAARLTEEGRKTYRIASRLASNYADVDGPIEVCSPKYAKIIDSVLKSSGHSLVYSQFVSKNGLERLSKILSEKLPLYKEGSKKQCHALLTGNLSLEERSAIVKTFNSPENIKGSLIKVLLVSAAGAEGLDLKRIRTIHIVEPFWNYARINQVKTRGIRYMSHVDLPPDQRNVKTFVYLSSSPYDTQTTDEYLYKKASQGQSVISQFEDLLRKSSIDCYVHSPTDCKRCAPGPYPMFLPFIEDDMRMPSFCKPIVQESVVLEEHPTKKGYMYDKQGNIYKYIESTDEVVEVDPTTTEWLDARKGIVL